MSQNHKKAEFGDELVERLAHRAARNAGWLMPETEDEVAQAELELAINPVPLPPELADPSAILNHLTGCQSVPGPIRLRISADVETNLARAAREGSDISPDVEARMRADREAAERDADGRK